MTVCTFSIVQNSDSTMHSILNSINNMLWMLSNNHYLHLLVLGVNRVNYSPINKNSQGGIKSTWPTKHVSRSSDNNQINKNVELTVTNARFCLITIPIMSSPPVEIPFFNAIPVPIPLIEAPKIAQTSGSRCICQG